MLRLKTLYRLQSIPAMIPEISGGILDTGIDRGAYPQARTLLIGLDL
ncbi:hypothetical protein ACU8V7_15675 [Zobellia nedashkovskayae]